MYGTEEIVLAGSTIFSINNSNSNHNQPPITQWHLIKCLSASHVSCALRAHKQTWFKQTNSVVLGGWISGTYSSSWKGLNNKHYTEVIEDVLYLWEYQSTYWLQLRNLIPDSKVHGANMGPTWPCRPHRAPCRPHEPCYQGMASLVTIRGIFFSHRN